MDGWKDEWTDGWMDGRMDGSTEIHTVVPILSDLLHDQLVIFDLPSPPTGIFGKKIDMKPVSDTFMTDGVGLITQGPPHGTNKA